MEDYENFIEDPEDFIENTEEVRQIAALIKRTNLPEHVDKFSFGRLCLNEIINQEVEREMDLAYDDFYGTKKPISKNYNLGSW